MNYSEGEDMGKEELRRGVLWCLVGLYKIVRESDVEVRGENVSW